MDGVYRPTRLVYNDDKGLLRMDEEAVSILQDVKGPICVVSICGPGQHGKSYVSNQLVGETSGFKVAQLNYPDRCTKGLWMWIAPEKVTATDGTEYNILVIDTEGIDSRTHIVEYFYLAVVLSSMLVYNQIGHVCGSFFFHLSVVTEINDLIVGDTTRQFSPTFVCLFRDFCLRLEDLTPTQYLEYSLKQTDVPKNSSPHTDESDDAVDKITKSIKAVFPKRHCFVLERPLFVLRGIPGLEHIKPDDMGEAFKNGMDKFRSFVYKKSKPKKIGKKVVTGPILVKITQSMLDAFNSGKRPTLASILENVTEHINSSDSSESGTTVGDTPAANDAGQIGGLQFIKKTVFR